MSDLEDVIIILLLSDTVILFQLKDRCLKQEFLYLFSIIMVEDSLNIYKFTRQNNICVACLLFVETQSCSDLGEGVTTKPSHIAEGLEEFLSLPTTCRNCYVHPTGTGCGGGGLGAGLAPPRSPELRRHSDVSPASLKELEKGAGERREELRWEREIEWRQHGKRESSRGSPGTSRVGSPQIERRPFGDERNWDPRLKPGKWKFTVMQLLYIM